MREAVIVASSRTTPANSPRRPTNRTRAYAAATPYIKDVLGKLPQLDSKGAEDVLEAVGGEVVGPRQVERAAERLGERRAGAGDDDGFTHVGLLGPRLDCRDAHDLDQILGRRQPRLDRRARRRVGLVHPGVPGGI